MFGLTRLWEPLIMEDQTLDSIMLLDWKENFETNLLQLKLQMPESLLAEFQSRILRMVTYLKSSSVYGFSHNFIY